LLFSLTVKAALRLNCPANEKLISEGQQNWRANPGWLLCRFVGQLPTKEFYFSTLPNRALVREFASHQTNAIAVRKKNEHISRPK
jgi:hypothetical protein